MKVINVLADGTVLDSIEGYVIPYNEATENYYNFIVNLILEDEKDTSDN